MWVIYYVDGSSRRRVANDGELKRFLVNSGGLRPGSKARAEEAWEALQTDGHLAVSLLPNEPAFLPVPGVEATVFPLAS